MFPGTRLDISRCSQGYMMQISSVPISNLMPRARAAADILSEEFWSDARLLQVLLISRPGEI
jgi:hypothetical protein